MKTFVGSFCDHEYIGNVKNENSNDEEEGDFEGQNEGAHDELNVGSDESMK